MNSTKQRSPRLAQSLNPANISTTWYVVIALVGLIAVFTVLGPEARFLGPSNLQSIGRATAGLLLLAVGLTFVLATGNIDLSVGSTVVLSSVVSAKVIVYFSGGPERAAAGEYEHLGLAITAGVLSALAVGIATGFVNGFLTTRLRIHSFIVTLGTMGIALGLAQVFSGGSNIPYLPSTLQTEIGLRNILGIPLSLLVAIAVGGLAAFALKRTAFGRHTLATGSSYEGARRAGVRVDRTVVRVFVLTGGLAGLAGFIDITRFGTTAIAGHEMDILQALSGVLIGGTSLFGGRASVTGSMAAIFLPTTLLAGFVMIGVGAFYQEIAIGVVLILAVWIDVLRHSHRSRT